MTAVTGARGGLKAHQDSIRLPDPELVRDLQGPARGEARRLHRFGEGNPGRPAMGRGERKPSADVMHRCTAYHVAALLAERDSRAVVQAWFQGMNPQLDDVPPARLLREGQLDDAGPHVLAARRSRRQADRRILHN